MKLSLSISTCPNDTFMFDALLHGRIDTEGLSFDLHMADIERLNDKALEGRPDITKFSYAVLPQLLPLYRVLDSGSALGRSNGPLLVGRRALKRSELAGMRVAIPGEHTTANLLLERLYPEIRSKTPLLFSKIAPAVLDGRYDAGVLIHEGRFTYRGMGLRLVKDLGVAWEEQTGLPLPLGGIAVSRRLNETTQRTIGRVLRRSVEYALARPQDSAGFVRQHAQEMSQEVSNKHIWLFVNTYSISLGYEGRQAVVRLLSLENEEVFL